MAAREAGGVVLGKSADKLFSLSGLFAVYKPKGPTSAGVLNLLKERLLAEAGVQTNGNKRNQVLKIGHGGTLDSAAAGVLGQDVSIAGVENSSVGVTIGLDYSHIVHCHQQFVDRYNYEYILKVNPLSSDTMTSLLKEELCFKGMLFAETVASRGLQAVVGIGKGTKMLKTMLAGSKKYTAIGLLGKATDTLDATGKVTEEKPYDQITKGDLENVLQKFTGDIMQVPPLYSALKKDGERLSTLMKRGEAVEAKPARPVRVYNLSLQQFQPPLFTLDVECGGGFYVRSLVSDIGKELSTCATMQELTRTKHGPFTLEEHALYEDKWTIDEIARSLEHCTSLLPGEPSHKKLKTEHPGETAVSCEDK